MNLIRVFGYLITVLYCIRGEESTNKRLKLSDLPVLKKWEIPNHQFAKHVGRKYKDLDRETKRSSYWELKPEFTANELDWDEDPEKLQLDFNYKNFFDDEDEGVHAVEKSIVTHKQMVGKKPEGDNVGKKKRMNLKVIKNKVIKTVINKSLKKHSSKKHSHNRSRRSIVDEHDGDEENDESERAFIENIQDGDEFDDELRMKRAAIWDAVRRIQLSQGDGNEIMKRQGVLQTPITKRHEVPQIPVKRHDMIIKQQNRHPAIQYPTPLSLISHKLERSLVPSPAITKKSRAINQIQQDKNQRSAVVYVNEADIIHKAVTAAIESKKKFRAGELGDEQIKRTKVKHLEHNMERKQKEVSVNAITRENIVRPKEYPDVNVDSSNVARAVTMAMDQLKRDKMWGKVFVHVRPSGQLKVMVQETKKMEGTE